MNTLLYKYISRGKNGIYSGFRSYEVHLKPPYRLRGGFRGGVLVPHNIGKCCMNINHAVMTKLSDRFAKV